MECVSALFFFFSFFANANARKVASRAKLIFRYIAREYEMRSLIRELHFSCTRAHRNPSWMRSSSYASSAFRNVVLFSFLEENIFCAQLFLTYLRDLSSVCIISSREYIDQRFFFSPIKNNRDKTAIQETSFYLEQEMFTLRGVLYIRLRWKMHSTAFKRVQKKKKNTTTCDNVRRETRAIFQPRKIIIANRLLRE